MSKLTAKIGDQVVIKDCVRKYLIGKTGIVIGYKKDGDVDFYTIKVRYDEWRYNWSIASVEEEIVIDDL